MYIAHIREENVYPAHYRITDDTVQTVEEHLESVKTKCGIYAEKLKLGTAGKLLGILHDMGKFTDEFHKYITEVIDREKRGEPKLVSNVDHGKYGALLILERYHNGDVFRRITSEIIAMIICYHHGGMEDYISDDLEIKLYERCGWPDRTWCTNAYSQTCIRFFEKVISSEQIDELFEKTVTEIKVRITNQKSGDAFSRFYNLHLIIKFLYSCLIDADRYDTYLFMQKKQEEPEMDIISLWDRFSDKLEIKEKEFQRKNTNSELEEKIKMLRHNIWKQCSDFGSKAEGIYTLTVPTGGGKTLASLRYALNHARIREKKRILYVLPFTAIIEQNAGVVRDVLEAGDYLLEHHSNVISDIKNDPGYEAQEKDEWEYRHLLTEQWSVPIIFTTMVQFLNTFFAAGTQDIRRFHNLTDTILIFDEIQALPIKCISLFNEAINFLSDYCRDTIILCSATQPQLDNVNHKIHIDGEIITDLKEKFIEFNRMEIRDERYRRKMSISELGNFIWNLKKESESILIVLNTKKAAEEVYKEVKKKCEDIDILFYFLSTNLCPAHRKKIISEMKKALGAHKQVICVSTQLIEAGVDISFACVVRHIAGLDFIAQASGRGNRNGEGSIKNTYIIQLEDERLGSLKEIELGEQCSCFVLDEYKQNRERFDNNLLSPKAIERYYEYFFREPEIEKKMDYLVSGKRESILDMLSITNKKYAYKNMNNRTSPIDLEFQFKTAAKNFEVIEENTIAVLVPYGDGRNIISKLLSNDNKFPEMKLIRSAQLYTVNISDNMYQKLKLNQAVVIEKKSGVLILRDNFYDIELGVVPEGKKLDPLFIGRG